MIVVKYGGHAMEDSQGHFAQSIKNVIASGESCVIVHGGGPQIDAALKAANIPSEFVGGFRVTTKEILAVATDVLNNQIQPKIVEQLESAGLAAVGIAGSQVLRARKQQKLVDGSEVDLGFVGDVIGVGVTEIENLLDQGKVVVISPIASAGDGSSDTFNVNADLATAAVAGALQADLALFLTDVAGIYRNWPDTDSLISEISAIELNSIKGSFVAGMAPKVAACLAAVSAGAKEVRVIDGRSAEIFQEAFTWTRRNVSEGMMAKNGNDAASAAWNKALTNNYGTPTISLISGKGAVVKDVDGKSYIDFLGGIATNVLGHAHPSVVAAVRKQIGILSHVSNFYSHPQMLQLAEKLQALTGDPQAKVFFCNSGAEANEAALKLSRKTGRSGVMAMKGAFHGRTMGALSLTGQPSKRDPFKPLIKGITHVPYNDIAALRRKVSRRTAMVIVEPVMGEQGVVTPDPGYLKAIREICTNAGALMVIDCVQTGMGRTGEWFGYEAEGIRPDVITLAKGLGGGLPLGAMIALGSASELFAPGDHGSTFGGNSVSCAAANAAIAAIEREKLLPAAKKKFSLIKKGVEKAPGVDYIRGAGLLIGIVLKRDDAKAVASKLSEAGYLVNAAQSNVIRIAPPLNVTTAQVAGFIKAFNVVMKEITHG